MDDRKYYVALESQDPQMSAVLSGARPVLVGIGPEGLDLAARTPQEAGRLALSSGGWQVVVECVPLSSGEAQMHRPGSLRALRAVGSYHGASSTYTPAREVAVRRPLTSTPRDRKKPLASAPPSPDDLGKQAYIKLLTGTKTWKQIQEEVSAPSLPALMQCTRRYAQKEGKPWPVAREAKRRAKVQEEIDMMFRMAPG